MIRGMSVDLDVLTFAVALFGVLAAGPLLVVATVYRSIGGAAFAAFGLLASCYGLAVSLNPAVIR
jgi:hypothetical protein